MEAKELMIGNYVKSSNIVFCIERITTKEVFMYSHGHGIRAADSCKKIQPIPITDELLSKIGFVPHDSYGFDEWEYDCDKYHLRISKVSNSVGRDWSCHIDNAGFETIGSGDIHYVHQLQNLVSVITGEILKINI